MLLIFLLMKLASMVTMFGPNNSGQDSDVTRRTYLRHIKTLRDTTPAHAPASVCKPYPPLCASRAESSIMTATPGVSRSWIVCGASRVVRPSRSRTV